MSDYWRQLNKLDRFIYLGAGVLLAASCVAAPVVGLNDGIIIVVGGIVASVALALIPTVRAAFVNRSRGALEMQVDKELDAKWKPGSSKIRGLRIYDKPWYILAGEPSTGKTTAIKKAGLPPAIDSATGRLLHDPLQGEGGTKDFDWWFFQNAVLLDTAGRLVSEPGPGWKVFLEKVKAARAGKPINGMILAISAEDLLVPPRDISERAAVLASQVEVARLTLGVRFPVYVMITKADKIGGFAEFFPESGNPTAHFQMVGWSNPENPLVEEVAFDPNQIARHLAGLAATLKRRRQTLLTTPPQVVPESSRRIDQLDQLYSFPENLQTIAANLRLYLEAMFPQGQSLNTFPAFFRGVYFTSSLRTGDALDRDLQAAFDLKELPKSLRSGGTVPLFVRDLFQQKVFGEAGLVAPLENVRSGQSRRRLIVLGSGIAAAAVLVLATVAGISKLKETILQHSDFWANVRADLDANPASLSMYGDSGYQGVRTLDDGRSLLDLHKHAAELSTLNTRFVLFSLADPPIGDMQSQRVKTHRMLFDHCVLQSLVFASAQRLASRDHVWTPQDCRALMSLVRLVHAGDGADIVDPRTEVANLLSSADSREADLRDWLAQSDVLARDWGRDGPPQWVKPTSTDPTAPPSPLAQETELALESYNTSLDSGVTKAGQNIIKFLRDSLQAYDAEKAFCGQFYSTGTLTIPQDSDGFATFSKRWKENLTPLVADVDGLRDGAPDSVKQKGLTASWDDVKALAESSTRQYADIDSELNAPPIGPGVQWLSTKVASLKKGLLESVKNETAAEGDVLASGSLHSESDIENEILGNPSWKLTDRVAVYQEIAKHFADAQTVAGVANFIALAPELDKTDKDRTEMVSKDSAIVGGTGDFAQRRTQLVEGGLNLAAAAHVTAAVNAGLADVEKIWEKPSASLVASDDPAPKDSTLPALPLVNHCQPININPDYVPDRKTHWLQAWNSLQRPPTLACLDQAAVADELSRGDQGMKDYGNRYKLYWSQEIKNDLQIEPVGWTELPNSLSVAGDGAKVNADLLAIENIVAGALGVQPAAGPWSDFHSPADNVQGPSAAQAICDGWKQISKQNVEKARNALLDPQNPLAAVIQNPVGDGLQRAYWKAMDDAGVRALAAAFNQQIRQPAMADLRQSAKGNFPFDPSGQKNATRQQATTCLHMLRRLRPTDSDKAFAVVAVLRDGSLSSSDRALLDRMQNLVPWIDPDHPVTANLTVADAEGTDWSYMQIAAANDPNPVGVLKRDNETFTKDGVQVKSPVAQSGPGDGFSISVWKTDEYGTDDAQNTKNAFVCNDYANCWSILHLLHDAQRAHSVAAAGQKRVVATCTRQGTDAPIVVELQIKYDPTLINPFTDTVARGPQN